ncbi:peptidylprolyl isomerase [Kitasatospora cheerisanensis]|uniref:Peptidyl-prolyl cis-trans isomerase n=1 Tax=Kitasatospora cheerisanensis KCTC 2395 TaxID=1348663 RepID=A0A066Z8X4_9ACTN|nr:peptidylprolyl isomerase [Kitasatospora cheerisanensis]KDN86776.1 peptidyl-prolyl cis-trans isomerase [Kitasatospora cheerisanensis KCTC 2395]
MVSSEQRRRELAREKYKRQMDARAKAAAQRKKRNAVVASVAAVVVLAGAGAAAAGVFGSDKKDDKKASAAPTPAPSKTGKYTAEPAMSIDTAAPYTASLDTSAGKVTFSLEAAKAPHTVNSFVFLAGEHFWDNTKCHRLTTDGIFVLQCGDPTGTGTGGPGYEIPDENLTGATYPAGTVAMANAGPNTNGSQFFLVYKDTQLPPNYTPFGKITGGLDVLQKIAGAGVQGGGSDGAPATPVEIKAITAAKG